MARLTEAAVNDLASHLTKRTAQCVEQTMQLVDDPEQRFVIATYYAAQAFGLAARMLQQSYADNTGEQATFAEATKAVIEHIQGVAGKIDAPPLPAGRKALEAQDG